MKLGLFSFAVCILASTATSVCKKTTLCGYTIASPRGVAACPLTTGQNITDIADLGYGVITYKTIRSSYCPIRSSNIYHVAIQKQLTAHDIGGTFQIDDPSDTPNHTAITNAYGINSLDTHAVIDDIQKVRAQLSHDQVLIVSIYGSGNTKQEQINDFVETARIAVAGGAQIVEANLSCPNIGYTPDLYKNPESVYDICKAITTQLPHVPLLIKVGVFDTFEQTKAVLLAAHAAGVQGVCGINTIPAYIVDKNGRPVYGPEQPISGVSGAPLFSMTVRFIKDARTIIDQEKLPLALLATGGVTKTEDFDILLAVGADIALSATHGMVHHEQRTAHCAQKKELIRELYRIGAIKTGNFILKSGIHSPIYFDMRLTLSHPALLRALATEIVNNMPTCTADVLCGVPHGAVPLATLISSLSDIPLIMPRKEIKAYGMQKAIEGSFNPGDRCLVVEDVISSGASILETVQLVQDNGLHVSDVMVVIDREQGGKQHVERAGYKVHAICTISELLQILRDDGSITDRQFADITEFCARTRDQ